MHQSKNITTECSGVEISGRVEQVVRWEAAIILPLDDILSWVLVFQRDCVW